MKKNQFRKLLINYLEETLGEQYESGITCSDVNNGVGHECLSFREKHSDFMITFDVSTLFEIFNCEGGRFEILSGKIREYYDAFIEAANEAASGKIDRLKENVHCRLVNYEMNRARLDSVPYEKRLDMAVIYCYSLTISDVDSAAIIVDYGKFVDKENEDMIRKSAWENTLRDEPPAFCLLSDIIGSVPGNDLPLYVISNSERYYGSIVLFYPGFMKKISDEIGSDLYIIPSSIHECLVLPAHCVGRSRDLREMVHTINRAELARDEILSDSIYYYSRKKDCISIDI